MFITVPDNIEGNRSSRLNYPWYICDMWDVLNAETRSDIQTRAVDLEEGSLGTYSRRIGSSITADDHTAAKCAYGCHREMEPDKKTMYCLQGSMCDGVTREDYNINA